MARSNGPLARAKAAHRVGLAAGRVRSPLERWNAQGSDGLADRRAVTNGGHHIQPTEPLRPLVREVVDNKGFEGFEAMEEPPVERCRWLIDHPEVVCGAVGFHWAIVLNGYYEGNIVWTFLYIRQPVHRREMPGISLTWSEIRSVPRDERPARFLVGGPAS